MTSDLKPETEVFRVTSQKPLLLLLF